MNVEGVLGPIARFAEAMKQRFLNQIAGWIRDQNRGLLGEAEAGLATQRDGPGRDQQDVKVAQLLSHHSGDALGDIGRPVTTILTAQEWRQELGVEAGILRAQPVVRDRWPAIARKLLVVGIDLVCRCSTMEGLSVPGNSC